MPLRLVTGRANAGKTGVAYEIVRKSLAGGGAPILVVPSEPDVDRATVELSGEFPLGVRAYTFERLVGQLWEAHGDGRELVSPTKRRLLIRSVEPESSQLTGGVRSLAESCVVKLADQTGSAWRRPASAVPKPGETLAGLIAAYASALDERDLVEPGEATRILASGGRLGTDPLVLNRFADLTASQEAFVAGASAAGVDVCVTLTWEQAFAPTEALTPLVDRLLSQGAMIDTLTAEETFGTAAELLTIGDELFEQRTYPTPAGAVRLSTADGPEGEATRIAEEVSRLVLEGLVSPERIAVVFRDPQRHEAALAEAFRGAGIRADFDVLRPFGATTFGSAMLSLLGFLATGRRDRLLAFLRSRFSGADRDELATLEAKWRRQGVCERAQLETGTRGLGQGTRRIVALARTATEPGESLKSREWRCLAGEMFALGYGRSGAALPPSAELEARAYSAFCEAISEAEDLGLPHMLAGELADLLSQRSVVSVQVERHGYVQVTGVTRVRGRRFDAVVIGGLNAGEFPARASEEALPGGAVAEVLRSFGGAPEDTLGAARERLLFYQAVTRARGALVVSALTTDCDGNSVEPSPFLEELLDFYRQGDNCLLPATHRGLAQPGAADAVVSAPRERLRARAFRGEQGIARIDSARGRSGSRSARLTLDSSAETLAERRSFSASEIEAYLACPYRWFYERALRAEQIDAEVGRRELGTFAHNLLAVFYRRFLEETGESRITASSARDALEVLAKTYAEMQQREGRAASMLEELGRREALRWARRLVEDDQDMFPGFSPCYFEWEFAQQPVKMADYLLVGRVDRIDVDADGHAIVTDYKSSGTTAAAKLLAEGKVQLPLYLHAVRDRLGFEPVGGVYRALSRRDNRGMVLDGVVDRDGLRHTDLLDAETFAELSAAAIEMAADAVAGMRAAAIPCRPITPNSCKYCRASGSCSGGR